MSEFLAKLLFLFVSLAVTELKDWMPWFSRKLLNRAIAASPLDNRERFGEEWTAEFDSLPGKVLPMHFAASLWWRYSRDRLLRQVDSSITRWWVRSWDIAFSAYMLLSLLPIFAIVVLAIKMTTGRPAFYWQPRLGTDGKWFRAYRFNVYTREGLAVLDWKDERNGYGYLREGYALSKVGRFLRLMGLERVPMLWNVLKGDMSILGPRPELLVFASGLEDRPPLPKLSLKPGYVGDDETEFEDYGVSFKATLKVTVRHFSSIIISVFKRD